MTFLINKFRLKGPGNNLLSFSDFQQNLGLQLRIISIIE